MKEIAKSRPGSVDRHALLEAMRQAELATLAARRRELQDCDCKQGMFPNPRRRRVLFAAGTTLGAAAAGFLSISTRAQHGPGASPSALDVPDDPTKVPGRPIEDASCGVRSPFETELRRRSMSPNGFTAWSMTPLASSLGIITPSGLHFERFRNGVPMIDPARHFLFVHDLVERPRRYSTVDLKRFPSVSRTHFIECNGNSSSEWREATHEDGAVYAWPSQHVGVDWRAVLDHRCPAGRATSTSSGCAGSRSATGPS